MNSVELIQCPPNRGKVTPAIPERGGQRSNWPGCGCVISPTAPSFHERVSAGKGSGQAVVRSKQLESRPDMKLCGQAPSRGEQRAVNDVDRKRLI